MNHKLVTVTANQITNYSGHHFGNRVFGQWVAKDETPIQAAYRRAAELEKLENNFYKLEIRVIKVTDCEVDDYSGDVKYGKEIEILV